MVLLGIVPAFLSAQNITDLAVMNDKSADASAYQVCISTVDNSVFPHPDRIRFDNRCIPKSVNERFRRFYLNGHCIGRCWQKGPQTVFYLPECWLNFGGENHLAVSLRPTVDGAEIRKAEIVPVTHAAESLKF